MRPVLPTTIVAFALICGLSTACVVAEGPSPIHIGPAKELDLQRREVIDKVVQHGQQPQFDPPQILISAAMKVQKGEEEIVLIPAIASEMTGAFDHMPKCRLVKVYSKGSRTDGRIIERPPTGFSDDFEPCESIGTPFVLDVNGDGTEDLIFPVKHINSARKIYRLMDVYLIDSDLTVCFSPEASGMFMPNPGEPELGLSQLKEISAKNHSALARLACAK